MLKSFSWCKEEVVQVRSPKIFTQLTMSDVDRSRVDDGLEQRDKQVWLLLTRTVLSILTFISFSD